MKELEQKLKAYKELPKWKGKIFMKDEETCYLDGYAQGAKENSIQWHDLRKDPNDLPENYMSIVNQDGEKVMYDYSCKAWRYDDADEYFCDTPIVWCEIPQFKENEE